MEPIMVIVAGILSLAGQLNNYGIDVEKNPHLKDIRVRRDLGRKENNNYEKISADFESYGVINDINGKLPVKPEYIDVEDKDTIQPEFEPYKLDDNDYEKAHEELNPNNKDYEIDNMKKMVSKKLKTVKNLIKRYIPQDQRKLLFDKTNEGHRTLNNYGSSKNYYDPTNTQIRQIKIDYSKTDVNSKKTITLENYRKKRSISYQQTKSNIPTASQTTAHYINNPNSGMTNKYNGYSTETTRNSGVNSVTEGYNRYNSLYSGYNNNNRYNGNNNGHNLNNNGYNGNNYGYNGYNQGFPNYSAPNNNQNYYGNNQNYNGNNPNYNRNIPNQNGYAYNNGSNGTQARTSTTTQKIKTGSVFGTVGCPKIMKGVKLFGKPLCLPDTNKEVVIEVEEDYMNQ